MTDPTTRTSTADCICGGSGMVPVDEDYVHRHAARMQPQGEEPIPGLLDALRDSVLPCYECRPTQYRSWAEGDYGPAAGGRRHARKPQRRGTA